MDDFPYHKNSIDTISVLIRRMMISTKYEVSFGVMLADIIRSFMTAYSDLEIELKDIAKDINTSFDEFNTNTPIQFVSLYIN